MTAFLNADELVNRLSGGNSGNPQLIDTHKEPRVAGAAAATPVAGKGVSAWEYEGQPSHGAVPPTSAANPTNTTAGGMMQTDPSGGRQLWAPFMSLTSNLAGVWTLYDRLAHISGLSGIVTTAQLVSLGLTRYTSGTGVWMAYEVYTQIGATGTTLTASYTNRAGTSGRTSQPTVIGNTGAREAQRLQRIQLQAGDDGIQAVSSITLAATTGTAGNFGIILGRTLARFNVSFADGGDIQSIMNGYLSEVQPGACLAWYFVPSTAAAMTLDAFGGLVER